MHPFYFTIYSVLSYTLNIFYPKRIVINKPKKSTGGTIFVSNHPASFMDPLAIAYFGKFTVFFMARADVFTKMTTPFLSAVHMLPIYRQQDGENTKEKKQERISTLFRYFKASEKPANFWGRVYRRYLHSKVKACKKRSC